MPKRNLLIVVGVCLLIATMGVAMAHGANEQAHDKQAKPVMEATEEYQDHSVAEEDGYLPSDHCVDPEEAPGGMGIHFANPNLIDDEVNPTQPEILVYEPTEHGLELVAVEYMSTDSDASLFGHEFEQGPAPGTYTLHMWVWKENPLGMFAPFNPNVECPDDGGNGGHEH